MQGEPAAAPGPGKASEAAGAEEGVRGTPDRAALRPREFGVQIAAVEPVPEREGPPPGPATGTTGGADQGPAGVSAFRASAVARLRSLTMRLTLRA